MAARPALKDRLFTGLCVLAALASVLLGVSRGNAKAGLLGAGLFLGYAALQGVTRRLVPAARLVSGSEADRREQLAHYRATRTAGQAGLVIAAAALVVAMSVDWEPGFWVAGTSVVMMAAFAASLWWFGRQTGPG